MRPSVRATRLGITPRGVEGSTGFQPRIRPGRVNRAFPYPEDRPDLFSYVGSFSSDLDLDNPAERAAVVETELDPAPGALTVSADSIFGSPIWALRRGVGSAEPGQALALPRGMDAAIYVGNRGDLAIEPVQAVIEYGAEQTALVTNANPKAARLPDHLVDWARCILNALIGTALYSFSDVCRAAGPLRGVPVGVGLGRRGMSGGGEASGPVLGDGVEVDVGDVGPLCP